MQIAVHWQTIGAARVRPLIYVNPYRGNAELAPLWQSSHRIAAASTVRTVSKRLGAAAEDIHVIG